MSAAEGCQANLAVWPMSLSCIYPPFKTKFNSQAITLTRNQVIRASKQWLVSATE